MTEGGTTDPVRAAGPSAVAEGRPQARSLVVLDPAGAAKHERIPAAWHDLEQAWRIVWCRMPSAGAREQAEAALRADGGGGPPVDIVASGPYGQEALRLAEAHRDTVRSVLLVDPGAETVVEAEDADLADENWMSRHGRLVATVRDAGVEVDVIAHSHGGPDDRVPAPIPLGHPDVVAALKAALHTLPGER
jgi:hypothetical protein